ncbi:Ig-like domain-containing protein [Halobacterium salinarum]|uniref:Ig-like domain-containing protein n=1 Tax=Halobacterium salinarum TaxID=2242 RepID=UPI002557AD38|nr:Ig-like domain-containing protein [Halobacterium salinarum]MDL0138010.1 Ig-like domain-containing protein [Halobacterium salinarum]
MRFWDDNRAVTVQIGAILLFGTLIISMSIYQVTIVPSQNADVEYQHSQTVQNQMTDVRNGILRAAATGTIQPASVTLGTQYPSRVFLVNPPPATGTLQTSDAQAIQLTNVAAINNETNHFFEAIGAWNTSTKTLSYEPNYHEYDNAPSTLYESSILSNYYPDNENSPAIPISNQVLVNEETNTITVVALNGSLSTSRSGSVSVEPVSLSAPYEPVEITPEEDTDPITLTVPTKVSPDLMETRTSLTDVSPGPLNETVNITLQGNYTLRTAKIGVGSSTTEPGPRYLTTSENTVVQPNEEFTVSVRDRFNNPVGDQNVTVTANGSVVGSTSKRVGQSGEVTFTYTGSGDDVTVSISGSGEEHKVIFEGKSEDDGDDEDNEDDSVDHADIAFVDSTSSTLKTVGSSRSITTYAAGGNVETVGSTVNLDADSAIEVTFVDTSGNIKYIDSSDSSPTTLLSSVSAKKDGIAAGTWQGSQMSVFFANNNDEDGLYRKAPGGERQLVATFPQKLRAVVGIGDIDDDGSDEIAAVTNGQEIAILDDDGSTYVSGHQPASSTGLAIGGVADYNGDGQERIAIVDGSNTPVLVGCGDNPGGKIKCDSKWGGTTTLSSAGQAKKAPFGKGDIDGDGRLELVYAENINSPAELYGVSVSGDTASDEAYVTRSDGTRIKVVVAKGVSEYMEPLSPYLLGKRLSTG